MFSHEAIMTDEIRKQFSGLMSDLAAAHVAAGRLEDKVDGMIAAYDKALADPQFRCPTYLMACIEALRP